MTPATGNGRCESSHAPTANLRSFHFRMPSRLRHPWTLRAATALTVAAAIAGTGLTQTGSADLQHQISSAKSAAATLKDQVDADSRQIQSTDNGLADARTRLTDLQTSLDKRVGELRKVQSNLIASRDQLIHLENRLHLATSALSANLVAGYEGAKPDLMTVILNSHGFGQLLEQVGFLKRVGHQDASIVHVTRIARAEVSSETKHLGKLEFRDRKLANTVLTQRNQVAALQTALLRQRIHEIDLRSHAAGRYKDAKGHIDALQRKLDAQERKAAQAATQAAETGNADVGGIAVDTAGMVQPPAGAPEAVRQIIAAGNAIATLPYIWGGGHASFQADGYDCSGSVSYVLAAAGLLTSPEVSGDFEGFGDPGPGQWVSIYASNGHVWMDVAGWRFDTVALAEDGTRWSQGGGEFAGFVVRHPAGL
jgi:peptidoglycan hydrolase CwlO-like protein